MSPRSVLFWLSESLSENHKIDFIRKQGLTDTVKLLDELDPEDPYWDYESH